MTEPPLKTRNINLRTEGLHVVVPFNHETVHCGLRHFLCHLACTRVHNDGIFSHVAALFNEVLINNKLVARPLSVC